MNTVIQATFTAFITRLYAILVRLYPRAFRAEFGEKMQAVFADAIAEATERGGLSLAAVCMRELRDGPKALLREHWSAVQGGQNRTGSIRPPQEANVSEITGRSGDAEARQDRPDSWTHGPGSWAETLAGMVPFLFIGLFSIVNALPRFPPDEGFLLTSIGSLLIGYLVTLLGFGAGWVRGFPRWSYAYVACVPLFSLYMGALKIGRHEFLGWRSLIPLGVVISIVLLRTRSLRPLIQLFTGVWRDWTRLSFALYALVPLLVWIAFDEVDDRFELPFMIALTLVLTGGALIYMRSARARQRALALLAGLAVSWMVATIGNAIYWHGRQEFWMSEPGNGYETARRMLMGLGVLVMLMLAPALLGLLRRSIQSLRAA